MSNEPPCRPLTPHEEIRRLAEIAFDDRQQPVQRRVAARDYNRIVAAGGVSPVVREGRPMLAIAMGVRHRRTFASPVFREGYLTPDK